LVSDKSEIACLADSHAAQLNWRKEEAWSVSPLQAPPSLRYGGLTHAAPRPTFHIQTRCRAFKKNHPMKNFTLIIIILVATASCKTDNFYETERYFEIDKSEYKIGDEFQLTAVIKSVEEKEIRFYQNFKNLDISFALINEEKEIHNGSWTERSSNFLKETEIVDYKISKNNPFEKTFKGLISEMDDEIVIEIPELNFKQGLPKSDFDENTKVRIHGHCVPINADFGASLEEFMEVKDVKIIAE
jgi:hypothetical protein